MEKIKYFNEGDKSQAYQGDVSIVKIAKKFADRLAFKPLDARGYVVAEGETTGNYHCVVAERDSLVEIAEDSNGIFVRVLKGNAKVVGHREHAEITPAVAPGILGVGEWFVGRQSEYNPLEKWRRVQD